MRRQFDLVCLGEPLLELNSQAKGNSPHRVFVEGHGGDASNVAVAAARQNARVAMLTAVGDDPGGRSFFAMWKREGVDSAHVRIDPERNTGLYFVRHDEEGHHFSYMRAHSAASRYQLNFEARAILEQTAYVFSSGISLGISDCAADAVFEAWEIARSAGGRIAFDTNYRPKLWHSARAAALIKEGLRRSDIAFPGLEDMTRLLGPTSPESLVDFCLVSGAAMVVLKMGSAGALLATSEGERVMIPPHPCTVVDATGAGDTFCGALLARLAAGDNPIAAAHYASCAAALATTDYGAIPPIPDRDAVMAALNARAVTRSESFRIA